MTTRTEIMDILKEFFEEQEISFDRENFNGNFIDNHFSKGDAYIVKDKFVIQLFDEYGGEDLGTEYWRIFRIIDIRKLEIPNPVFIKFEGTYSSWDDVVWERAGVDSFKIVTPQLINKIDWK